MSKWLVLSTVMLNLSLVTSTVHAKTSIEQQRELFQTTYQQMKAGELDKARLQIKQLKNYPLYPWLEFQYIKQNIKKAGNKDILAFIQENPNTTMSDQLYLAWGKKLAQDNDWSAISKHFPDNINHTISCYRAQALINTQQAEQGFKLIQSIWQTEPKKLSKRCVSLVAQLKDNHQISHDEYWARIKQAMHANQVTYASRLAEHLPSADKDIFNLWVKVRKNPKGQLPKAFKHTQSPKLMDVVTHGLERAALKKLGDALTLWDEAQKHFTFTPAERGYVESELGMWEAWRQQYKALERFRDIPHEHRTKKGNEWMARIALRFQEWDDVLAAINAMDSKTAQDNTWRYWKARALKEKGQTQQANQLFSELAHNATYYGFLAADELGQSYTRLEANKPDRTAMLNNLKKLATIQRWQEWMALGNRSQARREWFRLLKAMHKEGILATAELAQQQGDANLSIWTVSRTRDWNVVDLRFPMKYEQLVRDSSADQGIKPEWIYAVMRRESAFDDQAQSHVKALGLMQVMPATARQVARRLGLNAKSHQDILQPKTNVQLGSAYLKEMLTRFSGDYIRATAAYNAGPHRIPKWSPDKTMPAEQWVESIPFKETRNYVRAVMAYTTIYDYKLNAERSRRLSSRLKPITPSQ